MTIPGSLITPEVWLEARYLFETGRDQEFASSLGRWLGETIGMDVAWRSQMRSDLAVPGNTATSCRNGPDIGGRHFVVAPGEQPEVRLRQRNLVEDEGVVPAAVEIKKRHPAEQFSSSTEGQNAFGIEREVPAKARCRQLHPRHHTTGHVCQEAKFGILREPHLNIRIGRQRIEIVPCAKRGPFLNRIAHLSLLLRVDWHHNGREI